MGTISFKSVGQTQQEIVDSTVTVANLPIGIKTPLKIAGGEGLLEMHFNLEDQLADNLRNLLLTNWGERLGQYYFGANLKPLTTEFVSQENFDNEAVVRIKAAVAQWLPAVDLVDFVSEVDRLENKEIGIIKITISYSVPVVDIPEKKLQITLYVL